MMNDRTAKDLIKELKNQRRAQGVQRFTRFVRKTVEKNAIKPLPRGRYVDLLLGRDAYRRLFSRTWKL